MRALLTILLLMMSSSVWCGDMVVVVNKNSTVDKLDQRQVANIFLSKTNRLPDGSRVVPMELSDTEYKEAFYKEISGKNLAQIKSYWATLIFTGKGKPPRGVEETQDLITELSNNLKTISYLPIEQTTDAMKVVYSFP